MNEATPRPWKRGKGADAEYILSIGDGTGVQRRVLDLYYRGVSREERDANADLVVRAVNAHDALVEACEAALYTLRALYSESITIDVLRSALAKAKEV